ncbi:hypothetical protein E2C01_044665 [Portunus trituberculatus]|uniref:Uncharacterized protein n=1 Tax=Portunus trituberculatus TaxID=210409 RepID=A0A5B7FTQ6_PORTR|nr:hypothetical protein [Portunus trituberculatus]
MAGQPCSLGTEGKPGQSPWVTSVGAGQGVLWGDERHRSMPEEANTRIRAGGVRLWRLRLWCRTAMTF